MAAPRSPSPTPPWSLTIGPGEHLSSLTPLLDALLPVPCQPLTDLVDLLADTGTSGRLLLDGDTFPAEDLGLLRRFLERLPAWDLVFFGGPTPPPTLAPWIGPPRVSWVQWPPDVDQLRAFTVPAGQEETPRPEASQATAPVTSEPDKPEPSPADDEADLAAIEAILAGSSAQSAPAPDNGQPAPVAADPSGPILPPSWYRDQVADLADLAQGLELSYLALGDDLPTKARDGAGFQHLEGDLARLIQFTRTIGYIAAPPARGNQVLGLGTLVEEAISQIPRPHDDGPRFLYRSRSTLPIRSDKTLLTQALDALLHVARHCAGAGEIIRVSVATEEQEAGPPSELVTIDFPAGPLAGLALERVFQPYGLRAVLPDLGPNAILAAAGICRGQGGNLTLEEGLKGRLVWTVMVPAAADAAP
jgi:hypothetical protein